MDKKALKLAVELFKNSGLDELKKRQLVIDTAVIFNNLLTPKKPPRTPPF